MTISMSDADVVQAIEVAMTVGGLVALLIVGLLVYLVVRPPRRRRDEARPEPEAIDVEEMLALIDRMERRLDALERSVAAEAKDETRLLATGEDPANRRMK